MTGISEEAKDRYRRASELIYMSRADRKHEFNERAKATVALMREVIPSLSDSDTFIIFSSVSYLLSTVMIEPMATAGKSIEEMFDVYTLAASAVAGLIDLDSEAPAPTQSEVEREAMMKEIEQLRAQVAESSNQVGTEYPGNYL